MTTNNQILGTLLYILSVHGNPICKKPANIIDSNKYYIPPSETPDFNTLENYLGQLFHQNWKIPSGNVDLAQEVTDAVHLLRRKYIIAVTLRKNACGAIDQKWEFDGATIILKYSSAGGASAIYQMWKLGGKWLHYERQGTHSAQSTIREGNASDEDLLEYKREIDSWCEANRRFFSTTDCVIYDRLLSIEKIQ